MYVAHVKIKNILGIGDLEFQPGKGFTSITGRNGSGKSSVLEAIKAVAKGGHDATLLKHGEKEGEIVLVLDDGTQLSKRVTETKSESEVRMPNGRPRASPAEFIKAIIDQLSNNPVELLKTDKESRKRRLQVLLQALPINLDCERLSTITGLAVKPHETLHPIYVIDDARQQVFDARTKTNSAIKEKQGTISQLTAAMPEVSEGVDSSEEELDALLIAIDQEKDKECTRIDAKLAGVRLVSQDKIDSIKMDARAKLDDLRQQFADAELEEQRLLGEERERLAVIEGKASAQRAITIEKHAADREPVAAQIATVKAGRNAAAARAQALSTINLLTGELAKLSEQKALQDKSLLDVDAYKLELLASLPIPGLEVRGDEVYRNGVHFDRLNAAQRVEIVVEIAKLRAGKLPVICIDGFELMDEENFEEFYKQMAASGLQTFVSSVTDGPFEIRSMS